MNIVHSSLQRAFITQILGTKHAEKSDFVVLLVWFHFPIKILSPIGPKIYVITVPYEVLNAHASAPKRAIVQDDPAEGLCIRRPRLGHYVNG
jgi:hypothetical protein